ncbi:MAG: winged helix-turn-helix domain-containing protein [Gemmatimonadota bacterium]|nr:winged helix-turn-helix domain-containing protein [Gemmatimonadota bacterium]
MPVSTVHWRAVHEEAANASDDTRATAHDSSAYMVQRLQAVLDTSEPTPLYHQIASVVRWEIGMGRVHIGDGLPPLRELADALGVNYHTARQAYEALAADGVIEARPRTGTVIRATRPTSFWTPAGRSMSGGSPRVIAVECNRTQADELAEDVARAFAVEAVPWLLEGYGPPPSGVLLGTSFHAAEMHDRWPDRAQDIEVIDLELDPALRLGVTTRSEAGGAGRVSVIERDLGTARALAADVRTLLGHGFEGLTARVMEPDDWESPAPEELALVAPRVWDRLDWADRMHPQLLRLPFRARPDALVKTGEALGWNPR